MNIICVQNNQTTFEARIIKSKYLTSGIKYAQKHAYLNEKNDFLNALEYISKDEKMKTFCIKTIQNTKVKPGQAKKYRINIDGKTVYERDGHVGKIEDGPQCIAAVLNFLYMHYGAKVADRVLQKKNYWLLKVENLESVIKKSIQNANSELNKDLESFIK